MFLMLTPYTLTEGIEFHPIRVNAQQIESYSQAGPVTCLTMASGKELLVTESAACLDAVMKIARLVPLPDLPEFIKKE